MEAKESALLVALSHHLCVAASYTASIDLNTVTEIYITRSGLQQ